MTLAAANRTHVVRVSLIVVVHVAIVEVDVPRVSRIVGVRSTGPVVVGRASPEKMSTYLALGGTIPNNKGTNPCVLIPYR